MVGEIGAFNSAVQSERTYRENGGEAAARQDNQREVTQQEGPVDSVNFSTEAIALARNVPPAGEGAETQQPDEQPSPPPEVPVRAGTIDIQA